MHKIERSIDERARCGLQLALGPLGAEREEDEQHQHQRKRGADGEAQIGTAAEVVARVAAGADAREVGVVLHAICT